MCPAKSSTFRPMDASFSIPPIVKGPFPGCYPLKRINGCLDWLTEMEWTVPALAETESWKLVDLRSDVSETVLFSTGTRFLQAGIKQTAGFSPDGTCLTTVHDDGLYDWDLPPRMRWFTPWAWAALAATLAWGWVLWRLRRRIQRSVSAPAIAMPSSAGKRLFHEQRGNVGGDRCLILDIPELPTCLNAVYRWEESGPGRSFACAPGLPLCFWRGLPSSCSRLRQAPFRQKCIHG